MMNFLRGGLLVLFMLGMTRWSPAQILPPGATPTQLATGFGFTEGPVYDPAGRVLFTDLSNSRILSYDVATGDVQVVDAQSGGANGLFFDHDGSLVSMDGGSRRQVSRRSAADVSVVAEVLADNWQGVPFNSPNDLVIDAAGGIYFTDPDYPNRRAQAEAVYYLDGDRNLAQVVSGFRRPNGIMLSPDEETLYLAVESDKKIMAYDIDDNGLPINERLFAETNVDENGDRIPGINNGPDGMTVDPAGNLYAAVQDQVWAWDPDGNRLFTLDVPENPTNVVFGGADGKTLFITARSSLYGIELNIVPEPALSTPLALVLVGMISRARRFNQRKGHFKSSWCRG